MTTKEVTYVVKLTNNEREALAYARERLEATHNPNNVHIAEALAALAKVEGAPEAEKPAWEINCYEATSDGNMIIYLEDFGPARHSHPNDDPCMQVVVPKDDVRRLMVSAIDALEGTPSRR